MSTQDSMVFLLTLTRLYGEKSSPEVRLHKTLIEDDSGRFSIEAIREHAKACGFIIQVRRCNRDRYKTRIIFRPARPGGKTFVRWVREAGSHD